MRKKFSKLLAFVLALCFSLGLYGVSVLADNGDGEDSATAVAEEPVITASKGGTVLDGASFTFSAVPQGTKIGGLSDDIVNADINSDITVNIDLTNNSEQAVTINTFKIELDLASLSAGLSFVSFNASRDLQGSYIFAADATTSDPTCCYYSAELGDEVVGPFTLAANGGSITVATMTLHVDDEANGAKLTYGDVLDIKLLKNSSTRPNAGSNFHPVGATYAVTPNTVNGQVEIITTYDITWNVDGTTTNQEVGIGIDPTSESAAPDSYPGDPRKPGYVFSGWDPTVVPAAANATYTATWSAVEYDVTFADGTSFGDGVAAPTKYTIESGVTINGEPAVPVQGGCTFLGWTAEPVDEGPYNWNTATSTPITNTVGFYGNVKLTPVWSANADVVFANYKYANGYAGTSTGGKLMLVGVESIIEGSALFYNGESMFTTADTNYLYLLNAAYEPSLLSNGKDETSYTTAYIFIVPASVTVDQAAALLSVNTGANTAIARDGNVNCGTDGVVDSGDFGIVDALLFQRHTYDDMRKVLEADVVTTDGNMQFGSITDVIRVIDISNGM